MKDYDRWVSRYLQKLGTFKKIIRQFDNEKRVIRYYKEDGHEYLGISILEDDGDEWDEGIYENSDIIVFEDFKDEELLWSKMKKYAK